MHLVDSIADCGYLDFFSVVPPRNLVLGKKGVQVVHGPMSFALLLSTFFTSIFTSIPRTDNSIPPPSFCHSETRIGTLSLVNSDNRCSTYRIDGLNSVCLEERGEGVRSETDPTRLHLILKRNAVIRQFGKCLMNKKNCKVGDCERKQSTANGRRLAI